MEHQYGLYGLFFRPPIIAFDFFTTFFGFFFCAIFLAIPAAMPDPPLMRFSFDIGFFLVGISKTPIGLWVDLL